MFLFNKDCPNYWSLKPVHTKFVIDKFNPTPRYHYFPIWNTCRYFQTQSLAFCAKYNISHVSFILNASVEAINNTCHCTEKIPFEIGIFFFTVMINRPVIQPFKDKWGPNWTAVESVINDAISLKVDQISLTLANSTHPSSLISHCLHLA